MTDPDERLLLYGPTWRDSQLTRSGQWAPVNYLGADTALPRGWRLAFRGHSNTPRGAREVCGPAARWTSLATPTSPIC